MKGVSLKLLIGTLLAISLVLLHDVSQVSAGVSRSPRNQQEQNTRNRCESYGGSQTGRLGAIWISNTSNYHQSQVNIAYNDTGWVNVYIRGSAMSCKTSITGQVWASDLQSQNPYKGAVTHISSSKLNRGNLYSSVTGRWTTTGSNVGARLQLGVLNIGTNPSTEPRTINRTVGIYRCFGEDGNTGLPNQCATERVQISIRQEGRPHRWSINGQSYIGTNPSAKSTGQSNITAAPGDRIRWDHDLRNIGPNHMNRDVRVEVNRRDYSLSNGNLINNSSDNHGNRRGNNNQLFFATNNSYTIPNSKLGQRLCQRISWNPNSSTQSGWGNSTMRCVSVPYNYNLVPSVTSPDGGALVEAGGKIQVTGNISNTGNTRSRSNVHWRLTEAIFPSEVNIPSTYNSVRQNTQNPCQYLSGHESCNDNVQRASNDTIDSNDINARGNRERTVPDTVTAGDQICFMLSVRPYGHSSASNTWRHSAIACNVVSKQPNVHIHGGDVRTRGVAETGTVTVDREVFGSWVEYGGFSVGANRGFASASGLNEGSDRPQTDWHRLTFANINDSGSPNYGFYSLPDLPAITDQFVTQPSQGGPQSNLGNLASGTYKTGNFTINSSEIDQARSVVIVSSGTVTIRGDITYKSPSGGDTFTNISQIPQVVIVARNINIAGSVGQVDAWLLTTGEGAINTCSDVATNANLSSEICDRPLEVNGPVATHHLHLRRTGGERDSRPAELFNLRPDAYLWAYQRSAVDGKAQTVYSVELPPRF